MVGPICICLGHMCYNASTGSGLSLGPTPLSFQTNINFKYMCYNIVNKEHMAVLWLVESYEVAKFGGGPGVEPHGLPI
jgi:hypothetical protein